MTREEVKAINSIIDDLNSKFAVVVEGFGNVDKKIQFIANILEKHKEVIENAQKQIQYLTQENESLKKDLKELQAEYYLLGEGENDGKNKNT